MRRFEHPKTLVELTITAVREQIVSGELVPGERISEGSVAKALAISTTPVREAFQKLELEGLVTIVPRKGTYVFEVSPDDLNQLCEARLAIEPAALKLAFEHNRPSLINELSGIVADMSRSLEEDRTNDYLSQDTEFHNTILRLCGNTYLQRAFETVGWKVSALRVRLSADLNMTAKSFSEHKKILNDLKNNDIAAAIDVLPIHISRREGSYWKSLEQKWDQLREANT